MNKERKNWNSLPNELKLKIIEKCNFKTRIRVAMTCRNEEELVRKAKSVIWREVGIFIYKDYIRFNAEAENGEDADDKIKRVFENDSDSLRSFINAIIFVLSSHVKTLLMSDSSSELSEHHLPSWFFEELSNHAPFNFDNIIMYSQRSKIIDFFLTNRDSSHDKCCYINYERDGGNSWKFIENFDLSICRQLLIVDRYFLETNEEYEVVIRYVLKEWICKNLEIGARFLICGYFSFDVNAIIDNLKSTVDLENTEFLMRGEHEDDAKNINKPKTILIREETCDEENCITCVIIPTELRPSDYEKAADWYFDV